MAARRKSKAKRATRKTARKPARPATGVTAVAEAVEKAFVSAVRNAPQQARAIEKATRRALNDITDIVATAVEAVAVAGQEAVNVVAETGQEAVNAIAGRAASKRKRRRAR